MKNVYCCLLAVVSIARTLCFPVHYSIIKSEIVFTQTYNNSSGMDDLNTKGLLK